MQHNATQCSLAVTNAVGGNTRCGISRLSQKRAQPNGQRTSRTPAAPLRSKPNLPGNQRFARLKMQHNATQCSLASPMQSDGTRSCRIPRLSQKRAQPDRSNETQCNAMQRQIEVSKYSTAVPCKTSTARVRAVTLSPVSPSRRPLHPQVLSTGP